MVHNILTMTLTFKRTRVSGKVRVTKGVKMLVSEPFITYTPVCRHFLSLVVLGSWYLPLPLPTKKNEQTNKRIQQSSTRVLRKIPI